VSDVLKQSGARLRVYRVTALAILDSVEIGWEDKFDVAFRCLKPMVDGDGIRFDYYDPDTTYEADARAYLNALIAELDRRIAIAAIVETHPHTPDGSVEVDLNE
jgi:hypothetical protein